MVEGRMPEYVLRGVPACLERDAWWLADEGAAPASPGAARSTRQVGPGPAGTPGVNDDARGRDRRDPGGT